MPGKDAHLVRDGIERVCVQVIRQEALATLMRRQAASRCLLREEEPSHLHPALAISVLPQPVNASQPLSAIGIDVVVTRCDAKADCVADADGVVFLAFKRKACVERVAADHANRLANPLNDSFIVTTVIIW